MKAIITGCGQDASYLTELLIEKGWEVVTLVRRSSYTNYGRLEHLRDLEESEDKSFNMEYFDLADEASIRRVITEHKPDYFFNLAAQSHVGISFKVPESTINFNAMGVLRILEALRTICPTCKYYQASSSEMFGISPPPQSESTPMLPCSPYGVSKLAAYNLTRIYRIAYGMHCTNGILFNHESERRGLNFVTRKITTEIAEIINGTRKKITLGNLDAKRDWGHARDYMEAIVELMTEQEPTDMVISTGETYSIKEFLEEAFKQVGLDWKDYVITNDKYKRPFDVPALLGDNSYALKSMKWRPKVMFKELISLMLDNDLKEIAGISLEEAQKPLEYINICPVCLKIYKTLDEANECATNHGVMR